MMARGVDANMVTIREDWREKVWVVDHTCLKEGEDKEEELRFTDNVLTWHLRE